MHPEFLGMIRCINANKGETIYQGKLSDNLGMSRVLKKEKNANILVLNFLLSLSIALC